MDMINILNDIEKTPDDEELIKKAINHCDTYGKNTPEFQHLLGLMFYKKNRFNEALEHMKKAIYNFKKNDGYVPQFNEILNNCINMHKYSQTDIEECFTKKGIYCG
jgi:tetratricopeptide (TPR) repeat protein